MRKVSRVEHSTVELSVSVASRVKPAVADTTAVVALTYSSLFPRAHGAETRVLHCVLSADGFAV